MLRSTFKRLAHVVLPTATRFISTAPLKHRQIGLNPLKKITQPLVFHKCYFHAQSSRYNQQSLTDEEEAKTETKRQMLIGFTCKVCEERSHHVMSRLAYTKGVVLIQCPGCKNRHLIADNLGWFRDSKTTIEDLVKEKGEGVRKMVVDKDGVERMGDLLEWLPEIAEEEKIKKAEAKKRAEELKENNKDQN